MKTRLNNRKKMISRYIINDIYPEEHIISLGKRCNSNCLYCITDAKKNSNNIMSLETGKKIIDFIFTIPKDYYYIEFTGGEPFENFDVLFKLTDYAKNKAFLLNKDIHFSVVSNLIDLKPEYIKFIIRNNITICTSLDGPKQLHNKTRKSPYYKDTYSNTLKNLKKIIYYSKKGVIETPNIITTVTKYSLAYPKEIVDEYIKLNISRIQLGFLEPLGRAENLWKSIGYTYKDYLDFYFKAIDYIIYLNIKKEIPVYEKGLLLLLRSVLTQNNSRHRAIDIANRLAYDCKGNIYPSDETRIIGEEKDFTFKISKYSPEYSVTLSIGEIFRKSFTLTPDIHILRQRQIINKVFFIPHSSSKTDTLPTDKLENTPQISPPVEEILIDDYYNFPKNDYTDLKVTGKPRQYVYIFSYKNGKIYLIQNELINNSYTYLSNSSETLLRFKLEPQSKTLFIIFTFSAFKSTSDYSLVEFRNLLFQNMADYIEIRIE